MYIVYMYKPLRE